MCIIMWSKPLIIICLSSLPFILSGLDGDFVFDDSEAILKNRDIFSDSWTEPFHNDFWGTDIRSNTSHKSYRPLTILSFRLNYILSGYKLLALHFKITNLVFHTLCCICFWLCAQILLREKSKEWWMDPSFCASLLFAVHPVHVESVSGVVGRADLLAALTFFLTFLFYSNISSNKSYNFLLLLETVILSTISMLFKENGVTVMGFCFVFEIINKFKIGKANESRKIKVQVPKDSAFRILFLTILTFCILYGRWTVMGQTRPEFKAIDNPAAFSNNTFTKISTYNYIYFLNILLLTWPHWLCYDWSMGCVPLIQDITDYRIIFIFLLYLYGVLILRTLLNVNINGRHKRELVLAASLLAVPFLPAANIFYPVGFVIAERVLYIPSAGYCLLIALGYRRIIQRRKFRKFFKCVFLLLLLTFSLKTWHRSQQWKNEYNLFTSGMSVCPLNAKVHYNVAKAADAKDNTSWALHEYREAIRLYPEYYQAMNNLANLLKNEKQYTEAELYLRKAVNLKNDFPAAWMNLGIILANTRRYTESENAYRTALKYRRRYPDCLYNLGNLYLELNQTQRALENWFACIKLNPKHNMAWTNLLALLDNTGDLDRALQIIPDALSNLPESPSINFAVANIYGKMDRYDDAETHFKKAIRLFDTRVQAIHYANLGVLYHRWKKYQLAKKMYENALRIDPNFTSAIKNLQSLKRHIS